MIFATLVIPLIFILNIRMDFEMGFKLVLIEILNIAILIANRIKVTKQGITYHRQFFSWGEIQTIGVAVTKRNTPNKFFNKMIYISKKNTRSRFDFYHENYTARSRNMHTRKL